MTKTIFSKAGTVALAAILAVPFAVHAESNFQTGAAALSASAKVDFRITIPKILFLQVGTGTSFADNAAVDLIDFTVPAANVGDGIAIAGTGGNALNGRVTARVRANGGTVSFVANTVAALSNGAGSSINWTEITTTPAALVTGTVLAAPTLANGASSTLTLTPVGTIVNQDATWTYGFANSGVVAPGTYGGVAVNNGRVTYTASVL